MEVARSEVIERADLGAVVEHSRRAIRPIGRSVDVLLAQPRVVLAQVRVARSRLERAASDLKRPQSAIAEFPIRDGYPRSQPPSSTS